MKINGKQYIVDYKRMFGLIGFIFGTGIIYIVSDKPNNMHYSEYFQLIISNTGLVGWIMVCFVLFIIIKGNIWENKK